MWDLLLWASIIALDWAATIRMCRKARREGWKAGWDQAVLAQRAGLHTLLTRERK